MAPLPIGFAVFLVHLATIPVTGTGINPARSLGAALVYNKDSIWDEHVSFSFHQLFVFKVAQYLQFFDNFFYNGYYFIGLF